jgi:uncharacterized protein (UPF0335 family)
MVVKKEVSGTRGDIEEMVLALEERVMRLENERVAAVNNQFEIWMDNKLRGFSYGPDLKKVVMPQCVGRTADESRKIFFVERDKLVRERFPGQPTPTWV